MQNDNKVLIREVVGVFSRTEDLQKAIDELLDSGFERSSFGLLAGENTVRRELGDIYLPPEQSALSNDAPNSAFVNKESVGDTVHAFLGQLYFVGTTTMVGAAVMTAGVLGGAVLAATAGAVAVGAVGAVVGLIIHQSDAEYLEEHVNAGHLVFFVRLKNSSEEKLAKEILARHCNFDIKVLNVPAEKMTIGADMVPDIEGKKLVDKTGAALGEIDAVGKLDGMSENMVLIDLEGQMKEIAVPMRLIEINTDGTVTTSLSRAELYSYEHIDPWDYKSVDSRSNASVRTPAAH